jgi:amino acid adenylation domain-containing protein
MTSNGPRPMDLSPAEQRALLAQLLERKHRDLKLAPLSFSQERLWFFEQLEAGSVSNIMAAIRLVGRLDVASLEHSLDQVVRRHETLRTTFVTLGGQPMQAIAPPGPVPLPVINLECLAQNAREAETRRLVNAEAHHRFDLTRGPLFRATLLRMTVEEHVLILNIHHLVSDGWSSGVLIRELVALYQAFSTGSQPPLSDLAIQYADYARWQREHLQGEVLEGQLAYWKEQLGRALPVLELPTDRPRLPVQTSLGARESFTLSLSLSEKLKASAQQESSTLFMVLLAAFQVLLHRYTGQDDISVGTLTANRNWSEIEGLIGLLINTLVLRTDLSRNPTFRELIRRVRQVTLGAYAHQDIPFEKVLETLQPERDLSRTPLFQAMLVLQNMPRSAIELPGLTVQRLSLEGDIHADVDLALFLWESAEGLSGFAEYDTDLFDATTIRRMLGHFQTLLAGIVADLDQRIADLLILSEAERQQLLFEWSGDRAGYPTGRCIHELFEAQVERTPDAVAVVWGGQCLTYHELNRRANQLAHYLCVLGVGPETLVGICLDRSLEIMTSVLATLKAGGAYVPLDPEQPPERLALELQADTRSPVLLTTCHLIAEQVGARVIHLDEQEAIIAQECDQNLPSYATAENLAYVIYTSGSTGKPKGVMVTHEGLVNACAAWQNAYQLDAIGHCHLQMASFSFDVFVGDWIRALCSGAKLVLCPREFLLAPEDLCNFMRREKVDCGEFVPVVVRSLAQYLHETGQSLDFMRLLVVGSDNWYMREYEELRRLCPDARVISSYGLTEATIDSSYFESVSVESSDDESTPIGRPFANTRMYVLNPRLQPVPIGVPGELYVGGPGLARGYLNNPELTGERFIPNPFALPHPSVLARKDTGEDAACGSRLYKTGDWVRYLPDGNIQFLGRGDSQIKIRGFRVELGEIEAVLRQHSGVREAVVLCVARPEGPGEIHSPDGDLRLVAYIVPQQERSSLVNDLRSFVKEHLPGYMAPSAFVLLDTLPLTPSGKVDRRALPMPGSEVERDEYAPPETPLEEKLAQIWSQVLKLEKIGLYDNFFELGGHSLLATQVVYRINKAFQMNLSVRSIFKEPTVAGLALLIEERMIEEIAGQKQ